MKKLFIILMLLFFISSVEAKKIKGSKKSLIEIGPKACLYIGEDVQFGIGCETVFNPIRNFGLRYELTEIRFGSTTFYLNHRGSLDALIYIPMRGMQPYIHTGFGFTVRDTETPAGTQTNFSIRAGMGLNYTVNRGTDIFIEPGIIISGNGGTDAVFRLSFGGRFGILR